MMTIAPAARIFQTTGQSDELGGWCYFVMNRSVFGWRTSLVPMAAWPFFPSEYEVLPISAIESVEFSKRHALALRIRVRLKDSTDSSTDDPSGTKAETKCVPPRVRNGFDISVKFLYPWLTPLKIARVRLINESMA